MKERNASLTTLVTRVLLDFLVQNRGHRNKDKNRWSTRNLKLWMADRHRCHQKPETHGSNEDYFVMRRQPVFECSSPSIDLSLTMFHRYVHALRRIWKDDCCSVDYPVPTLPPSRRAQMLQKTKQNKIRGLAGARLPALKHNVTFSVL